MNILLTGADGFLGRRCFVQLSALGHDVFTTDQRGDVHALGNLAEPAFCTSLPDVDAVVHAAAVQYVSPDLPWWNRADYFYRNNILATENLCTRYAGRTGHLVNIGTSMMYRQNRSASYSPASQMGGQGVYSRSKLAAFDITLRAGLPLATIIPCIIGGPGRGGLFDPFVRMARRGYVVYPGSGKHKIAMVHVDDVASLVCRIIERRAVGLFNAAADDALCIDQWVDEIELALGLPPVRRIRLPLAPVGLVAALSGYRLLAREQLLMLEQPHVLTISESTALGWMPQRNCGAIIRETACEIANLVP